MSVTADKLRAIASAVPAADDLRVRWIDTARGFCILFVVLYHVHVGMLGGGLLAPDSVVQLVDYLLYSFTMGVFFLLSGLFALQQMRSAKSFSRFVSRAARTLLYPYLVWATVQYAMVASAGSSANVPVQPSLLGYAALLWHPPAHFWFLYALFVMHVWGYVVTRLPLRDPPLAGLLLALGLYGLGEAYALSYIGNEIARYGIFYFLGMLMSARRGEARPSPADERSYARLLLPGTALLLAGWLVAALLAWQQGLPGARAVTLHLMLLGMFALFGLSALLQHYLPTIGGLLATLGRESLPIYLLHVMVVAGVRLIALQLLGSDALRAHPGTFMAAELALGVGLPLAFNAAMRSLKIAGALGLR